MPFYNDIIPVFAFANAGVSLASIELADLTATIPLGIALGLFFGNQFAIFALSYIAVKLKIADLPQNVRWIQIYGVGCLAGVGFTMSLFIGTLAFDDPELINQVRLGVLMGSFASALLGYTILKVASSATMLDEHEESLKHG